MIQLNPIVLSNLQSRLGVKYKDLSLLTQALTHRSYGKVNNERLEFLGDSLVNMIVAELLFKHFPEADEGELSARRSSLVCRGTLAEVARELQLDELVVLGQSASGTGMHTRDTILCDAFEAIIGALYVDHDWQTVYTCLQQLFESRIKSLSAVNDVRDAKSLLQEVMQGKGLELPTYDTVEVSGPGHARVFRVRCSLPALNIMTEGEGSSRKNGQQQAAQKALSELSSPSSLEQ